ncbi:S-adenosyl-L-methionine-dependent methyltransferase [Mycotypha africana]|uniref:S-adenosyl-L-methionine-dependent methyltransferase n=1 Tax=Mycotypha africana TaxID=64632 RepID=UPI0023000684|nr:S-adenosyl-L-methionine-dependent methyltransferase [Mycotypha africana]KAI8973800.1 S-adenosyl-L-methionine-dependent methyltransferase [Mycotypha africana]
MSSNVPGVEHRDPQYFGYYAQLQHQQNMLQDTVRTSTYRSSILLNSNCFKDKTVMDVGAGSGILSYFAVQAGAKKVYAVEASGMANKMKKIVSDANEGKNNPFMKDKIEVINAKIEDPDLPIPQVDTIISEPIGVLLFHERMLESYIYARDHYLKPGGALFPSKGNIYLAPFTDATLWSETMAKARFWEQKSFYDIDLSSLYKEARDEMFGMPVVGHFDPRNLITTPTLFDAYPVDFATTTIEQLLDMTIPFQWTAHYTGLMHGVAGWFDLIFAPPPYNETSKNNNDLTSTVIEMSTGPAADRTHWQQVRFLFKEPLAVNAGQNIRGWMRCIVNDMRSYTIYVEVTATDGIDLSLPENVDKDPEFTKPTKDRPLVRRGIWELHEQTYNYSYTPGMMPEYKPEYACLYDSEINLDNNAFINNTTSTSATAANNLHAMQLDLEAINVMDQYEDFVN